MADEKLAARQREYEEALAYLRSLGLPDVQWILNDEREVWKVSQLSAKLGVTEQAVRDMLVLALRTDEREGMPGGTLISQQAGWSVSRRGVVVYLARLHRAQRERATG